MSVRRLGVAALLMACGVLARGSTATADVVYSDDFDVNSLANWNVNASNGAGGDTLAAFAFDYSTVGIPSAPNSTGGTRLGLKLQSNRFGVGTSVQTGISVSPKLQSFPFDYVLHADVWLNYQTPNGTGNGSTQYAGMGALTNGTTATFAPSTVGAAPNSVYFQVTLDGGNSAANNSDYRAFSPANNPYGVGAGTPYAATGTAIRDGGNGGNAYYATNFPSQTAPAGQLSLFPTQTGSTPSGVVAFKWRDWAIIKAGNTMTWKIDNVTVATIDLTTTGATSGTNFLLNFNDSNANKSTDALSAQLLFGLFDNVRVVQIPEANSWMFGAVACGALGLAWGGRSLLRRRADRDAA